MTKVRLEAASLSAAASVIDGAVGWRQTCSSDASAPNAGSKSGVQFDASLLELSGRLLYHVSAGDTEPHVGGAVGLTHFERTSVFPVLVQGPDGRPVRQADDVFRRDGTELTWGGVAGLRIRATQRVQVRPEVAVLITRPSNFVAVSAGVKIGWGL